MPTIRPKKKKTKHAAIARVQGRPVKPTPKLEGRRRQLSLEVGEMVAGVMGVAAQFQRRLIGQSTREALAVKRAQGVRLGRPRRCPDDAGPRVA